jgi:hypothetical protein
MTWPDSTIGAPVVVAGSATSQPVLKGADSVTVAWLSCYELLDGIGAYGTVPNGDTAPCSDCYQVGVTFGGTRPATRWDAVFTERITPDSLGQTKPWLVHVGESFADVPKTSGYYRFVETPLHADCVSGCADGRRPSPVQ